MTPNLLDLGGEHWNHPKIVERRLKFETLTLDFARVRGRKHTNTHPEATLTLDPLGLGEEMKEKDVNQVKIQTLDPFCSPRLNKQKNSYLAAKLTASVRVDPPPCGA
jgi:hypothetical protein